MLVCKKFMSFENYFDHVKEAADFLKQRVEKLPKLILVLSGGLSAVAKDLKKSQTLSAKDIPHYPATRTEGHKGELIFGEWEDFPIVCLLGRAHYYEGFAPQEVVFPYFVLRELGADYVITTNAVGGIRLDLNPGDVMAVTDHINHLGTNPLIGLTVQKPTDQFTSLQKAYDPKLISLAKEVAKGQKLDLKEGVFLGAPGPSYETPAEIKAYRMWGADTIGMSTIFEVIAANYLKLRVLTLNIISNPSADRHKGLMTHEEVLQAVKKSEPKVIELLRGVIRSIAKLS